MFFIIMAVSVLSISGSYIPVQQHITGLRFGLFYLGLFGTIFLGSMLISTIYLGGYYGPYTNYAGFIWLLIKTIVLVVISLTIWLTSEWETVNCPNHASGP